MYRRILAVFAAFLSISICGYAANENATSDVKIEAQGLRIVKPASNDKLRAFSLFPGTTVVLLLTMPQGGITAVDDNSCKVKSFVDDKGKDLTKSETETGFMHGEAGLGMFPEVSEDGKKCSIEVTAPGIPTKGASMVTVSGTIVLQVATQKKNFTAEKVTLKPGTKIDAGPIPFTITSAGKPEWGGDEASLAVKLEAKQNLDSVAEIQFLDTSGKKIEADHSSSESMEYMGNMTVTWTYDLKTKVDAATILISYWTDMKKVSVPFNLSVGVGL